MGIFLSCVASILGCCSYSILLGDQPNKYTLILGAIAGALIGIDFKLSEIKSEIRRITNS